MTDYKFTLTIPTPAKTKVSPKLMAGSFAQARARALTPQAVLDLRAGVAVAREHGAQFSMGSHPLEFLSETSQRLVGEAGWDSLELLYDENIALLDMRAKKTRGRMGGAYASAIYVLFNTGYDMNSLRSYLHECDLEVLAAFPELLGQTIDAMTDKQAAWFLQGVHGGMPKPTGA